MTNVTLWSEVKLDQLKTTDQCFAKLHGMSIQILAHNGQICLCKAMKIHQTQGKEILV